MLGRPFGVPNDAAFQERVLLAALNLLEAPAGPVLVDYPEDAPASGGDAEGIACPVSFARAADDDIGSAFVREVEELQPWHDRARERRGRSMVGLCKLSSVDAAKVIARFLRDNLVDSIDGLSAGETIKLVCEDLRTYYYEAAAARPGTLDADAVQHWFWHDTAGGRAFLALHQQCLASADASLKRLCNFSLVPRAVLSEAAKI
ncbi:MAG: hypothetical protein Q7R45_13800 [Sulfuricaulis sp.]|nr:hypothetical protein [Sulfuricaulis sp.]